MYLDPKSDQLQGPWVRTHGTKDYYDMVAMVQEYPAIHFTVNLTPSLIRQLQDYYIDRLKPFVDLKKKRIDAECYFMKWGGKTDPWIDLALKPTNDFTSDDLRYLLTNLWNAFGVSPVIMRRFPEYQKLKEKYDARGIQSLTEQDLREIKFWFYLANFDPDFLQRATLATGVTVDVEDLIERREDGTYWLKKTVTEDDCNRIVVETFKILAAILPIHKKLMYHPATGEGQVEMITTPYYHPILPLVYDSDLAHICQPNDPMPQRFHFPADAAAHVSMARAYYKKHFGIHPHGMWPAEGAVAHEVASVFGQNGVQWIATDEKILARSRLEGLPKFYPYALPYGSDPNDALVIVFRDTDLSDKIGFVYKHYQPEDAANDFIHHVLRYAPQEGEPDRLVTVILDGENAWEWYEHDHDAKQFLHSVYRKLSELYDAGRVVTATTSEYISGNPKRGIPAHSVERMQRLEWLYPGSWINQNFDTWIGKAEENQAWEYLLTARRDLEGSGVAAPNHTARPPKRGSKQWYARQAWEALYAAEGSDWFWWYGTDQIAPSGDKPFDRAFITFLESVYKYMQAAGATMPARDFPPIGAGVDVRRTRLGTMAQSRSDLVTVVFHCDARGVDVPDAIYLAGNIPELGRWTPNSIRMERESDDGIWQYELRVPTGAEISYKYTNSGVKGEWNPGEEFPFFNRHINTGSEAGAQIVLRDRFGVL